MLLEGQVGPQALSDGAKAPARLDRTGSVVTLSKYAEAVAKGNVFLGSIVGQVTSAGTNTTYTGLCLSNPNNSGVDLVLLRADYSFIVAFGTAAHIGLMVGSSTTEVVHTAAATTRNAKVGVSTGTSTGKLDSQATLPVTPTVAKILGSGLTGAITTQVYIPSSVDLDGSIVLPPGSFCAFYTSVASGAAAGGFSFLWEERPAQ
jgi:hypothetical protein